MKELQSLIIVGTVSSGCTLRFIQSFPQSVLPSPVILCIRAVSSSWNVLSPFTCLGRCHSFISDSPFVALVEALGGSPRLSEPASHFPSRLCRVTCLHTTYPVSHGYGLSPQNVGVFSAHRPCVHTQPRQSPLRAVNPQDVGMRRWCVSECPNKRQMNLLNSGFLILIAHAYVGLILSQARIFSGEETETLSRSSPRRGRMP